MDQDNPRAFIDVTQAHQSIELAQRANNMEIYRKEGQKWVYEMFKANDEIELTSLGVQFPLTAAYVDVDFVEETFSEEGNIYQTGS